MMVSGFKILAICCAMGFGTAWTQTKPEAAPADSSKEGPSFLTRERLQVRDPFKRELPKKQRLLKRGLHGGTSYTNITTLEGIPLERVRLVGVILGKQRSALVRIQEANVGTIPDGSPAPSGPEELTEVITVKEGAPLGVNGGEIRAILPGGIVVVEKIRNVYDQDEYLETIIPISD